MYDIIQSRYNLHSVDICFITNNYQLKLVW